VGELYKWPQAPVWVVGSASHFTVLFGAEASLAEKSAGERLFERVERAFKSQVGLTDSIPALTDPLPRLQSQFGVLNGVC
jgi:hypothetical protein